MLEARLNEAAILKRLLDAIKELVTDANFECNEEGLSLQAMDNSHVALVAVSLKASGFKRYRCDRPIPLGVNVASFTKVLKCAKDDDVCILKANDDADILSLTYEARTTDRIAEYEMKLMDIDMDTLNIPDTDYDARVTMPSAEFGRIVRDLSLLGESVRIEVSKDGVRFISDGEAANGNILLRDTQAGSRGKGSSSKDDEPEDEDEPEEEDDDEDKPKKKKVKKEKVKKEAGEDVEMNGDADEDEEQEFKPKDGGDDEDEDEDDEDEEEGDKSSKKRKKAPAKSAKPAKKAKKDEDDELPEGVRVEMNAHVNLTFSLKYLVNFSKSSSLSNVVQLMMSNDVPLLVSYEFGQGHVRYYLAPKIGDD